MILDLDGEITLGAGSTELRETTTTLVDRGSKKILLNLANVTNIDSSGLGELVAAHARIARHGGELKIVGLANRAQTLLHMTKLVTVFETFASELDAMRSFAHASTATVSA